MPAHADDAKVLKVSVIHATKGKAKIDPKLKRIAGSLTKAFGGYNNFRRLSNHTLKLAPKASVKLPGKRTAVFTDKGRQGKNLKLNLAIPKIKFNVDLTAPPGRVFFQAGLKHDKGTLILAMFLRPAKK